MATKKYTVPYRRKREEKTNYRTRIKLLGSRKPRLLVRRYSNKILLQVIEFSPKGDRVLCSYDSKLLKKVGWTGHTGNIPAAYLSGFYLAKKSRIKEAVPDIGLHRSIKGTSIYAAIKGAIDGGMKVSCDPDMFPSKERIEGKHTKSKDQFTSVKSTIAGEKT